MMTGSTGTVGARAASAAATAAAVGTRVILPIEGMSCAACVNRVEAALKTVPGVAEATVNLATERAQVVVPGGEVPLEDLRAAVRAAGYDIPADVRAAGAAPADTDGADDRRARELARLRTMAASSVSVVANSLRLRRFRPSP